MTAADTEVANAIKSVVCCNCKSVWYVVLGAVLSTVLIAATALAVVATQVAAISSQPAPIHQSKSSCK